MPLTRRTLARTLAALPLAPASWTDIEQQAKGQPVFFNAWGGDEKNNAYLAWAADRLRPQGIDLRHVKLRDTAEAVARIVAEKSAGRDQDGSVDLLWLNGPNFLALKQQDLLYGPVVDRLPNARLVDWTNKPSNRIDFTIPTDGYEIPWRMAQIVFIHDAQRAPDPPRSMPAFLAWAQANPGRTTHPEIRNFIGVTFLKQALYELCPDPARLQDPATDPAYAQATAPLWTWYDELRPHLWRHGAQFPANGPAQRPLMLDGEIDLYVSFNPAEAPLAIQAGELPDTARTYVLDRGTIGNTSFIAIPYNAAHKPAAMLAANFLLSPAAQARAQDPTILGVQSVLDPATLPQPAPPTAPGLGHTLLEPHPTWMTRLTADWQTRYTK